MPQNPPAKTSAGERIGKTAARHAELVIFFLGLVAGVILTLLVGAMR